MQKGIITKIPHLLFVPRRYFRDNIAGREYMFTDLIYLGAGVITALTLMHFWAFDVYNKYVSGVRLSMYLLSFVFGLTLSFAFRIYFLTTLLSKMDEEIRYVKIGMIVGVAAIPQVLLLSLPLLLTNNNLYGYIQIFVKIWNLTLILLGILEVTRISVIRGLIIVLLMFGFETLVKYWISG